MKSKMTKCKWVYDWNMIVIRVTHVDKVQLTEKKALPRKKSWRMMEKYKEENE